MCDACKNPTGDQDTAEWLWVVLCSGAILNGDVCKVLASLAVEVERYMLAFLIIFLASCRAMDVLCAVARN